jgi:hypothetical protein
VALAQGQRQEIEIAGAVQPLRQVSPGIGREVLGQVKPLLSHGVLLPRWPSIDVQHVPPKGNGPSSHLLHAPLSNSFIMSSHIVSNCFTRPTWPA